MGVLVRLVLRVLGFPFRLFWGVLHVVFRPVTGLLLGRLDRSPTLGRLIGRASSLMATQRGLLLMVGVVLLFVSVILHFLALVAMVSWGGMSEAVYWLCVPFAMLHVAVLVSFVGIMLATPLGQGYSDRV